VTQAGATQAEGEPESPAPSRTRRDRDNIRELLLESAIIEFGENGFEGASTRSIAERVDAHQPQINYHFATKAELWRAAIDHLFAQLADALGDVEPSADLADNFAILIRRLVEFSAARPQLHQIMTHESGSASERLTWLTETHVRPRYRELRAIWMQLQDAGIAAPIDPSLIHYVLIGAASLPYLNIAEARLLLGADPASADIIDRHVNGLIATLLPGRVDG
jgi:TetR/AcrR family transcriptional regulator